MDFVNCFGNNPGEDKPVVFELTTLDELNDYFFDKNDEYVWRGQSNFMWAAHPTLYRRLKNSGYCDERIFEPVIGRAERCILERAREEGLLGSDDSVFEFMARLQHHGGATRLLDVTTNYQVALYFAASEHPEMVGTVIAYRINPERRISQKVRDGKALPAWDELLDMARKGRPLLVEPAPYDRRIVVQSGAFLMTSLAGSLSEPNIFTHQTYDCEVAQILIAPQLKPILIEHLEDRGITREFLFPSIEGFAKKSGADKPLVGLG
ncbi:FRG domain-containing protein [Paratractidigestivibacter sp.]|uniref:FRG domain-containing protein n=1 Tax=Paratractidigestivibacter sp. TaxID=2847316 RepID=UPI002AC91F8F|nr:FRG domain-containing protein [Paratractidigestivibacter sp.]